MLKLLFPIIGIVILAACNDAGEKKADNDHFDMDTAILISKADSSLIINSIPRDSLIKSFDTVTINGSLFFLYQGDILLTREELAVKMHEKFSIVTDSTKSPEKHAMMEWNDIIIGFDPEKNDTVKWNKFPITYRIDKKSFSGVPGRYEMVRENMLKATNDWEGLCNTRFLYMPEADEGPILPAGAIDFVVTYVPASSGFIATAFFPNDPAIKRQLVIYPNYWNTSYDKTGVFRHEIGHILGFYHEHSSGSTDVPMDCRYKYPEASRGIPISYYDKLSVMHYFCGDAGTREMKFSRSDTFGSLTVYPKH
ncbi:hypothetical protein [Ferruginibacter sp. HRS2-29]|uniref:hypothetical protein n=1 Tax=Ferruginibacter sp. HRS2-29 TaxID=2487334 RepID=UPI0020CD1146|nr:hypothetical protein [Ferruginibacter sp. HRS2-29]MCP9752091.1 hypothetical protein [Ferruginibacter sp. HRS2-29]